MRLDYVDDRMNNERGDEANLTVDENEMRDECLPLLFVLLVVSE